MEIHYLPVNALVRIVDRTKLRNTYCQNKLEFFGDFDRKFCVFPLNFAGVYDAVDSQEVYQCFCWTDQRVLHLKSDGTFCWLTLPYTS